MMVLPSVDLPQPDSPTSPKTSPGIRSNETPSTALIDPMRRLNGPRTAKWTCRSTQTQDRLRHADFAVWMVAAHPVPGAELVDGRALVAARPGSPLATGMETAAAGRRDQPGHFARNAR